MTDQTKENMKRWLLSSVVTFLAGFAAVFVPQLNDIHVETFQSGAIVGLLMTAVRAGFKALLEGFVLWNNKRLGR